MADCVGVRKLIKVRITNRAVKFGSHYTVVKSALFNFR